MCHRDNGGAGRCGHVADQAEDNLDTDTGPEPVITEAELAEDNSG